MDLVNDGDGAEIDLAIGELIEAKYNAAIWAWQSEHGCKCMDMAPDQRERYLAWRAGGCDIVRALDQILARRSRMPEARP